MIRRSWTSSRQLEWVRGKVQYGVEPSDEALTHVRELRAAADARVAHGRPLRPPDSSTGAIDLSAPATLLPVAARGDDGAANADAAALPSSATGGGEPPKPPADDFPPVASGDLPDPADDTGNPADAWLEMMVSEHEHYLRLFEHSPHFQKLWSEATQVHGVEIVWGEPGEGSYYHLESNRIMIDEIWQITHTP